MTLCHRCGEVLPKDAGFCPNCGAVQLYLNVEDDPALADSAGTPPPPRPGLVEWPAALSGITLIAAFGFLLFFADTWSSLVLMVSFVFVLSAGQLAVDLYRRRRPLARLDAIVGARIGAATGILIAGADAMAIALAGWLERFPLHHGAQIDDAYAQGIKLIQPMMEKMGGAAQAADMIREAMIPEVRAGRQVGGTVFLCGMIFLVVTMGGVISGALNKRRRTAR